MGYQFIDTPTVTGILNPSLPFDDGNFNGWRILTENNTLAEITNYIGDTVFQVDRWGFQEIPPGYVPGLVEFKYTDGLMPVSFIERGSNFGGIPHRFSYPVPLFDKRGTKAVFIPPSTPLEEKIEETSFLYNNEDTSEFIQGFLKNAQVGNTEIKYKGYVRELPGKKIHPDIGSFVDLQIPEFYIKDERCIVIKYKLSLDTKNKPMVDIVLKRIKKWEPGITYPDLRYFFPNLNVQNWDPTPSEETLYSYSNAAGVHPLAVPLRSWPYLYGGVRRNRGWTPVQDPRRNLQNRVRNLGMN